VVVAYAVSNWREQKRLQELQDIIRGEAVSEAVPIDNEAQEKLEKLREFVKNRTARGRMKSVLPALCAVRYEEAPRKERSSKRKVFLRMQSLPGVSRHAQRRMRYQRDTRSLAFFFPIFGHSSERDKSTIQYLSKFQTDHFGNFISVDSRIK